MGAEVFHTKTKGKTAWEAFSIAVDDAHYQYGHEGYTGSIAEKDSFIMINLQEGRDPYEYAEQLIDECDKRIDDKWGPAGCFDLKNGEFYFLMIGHQRYRVEIAYCNSHLGIDNLYRCGLFLREADGNLHDACESAGLLSDEHRNHGS